MIKVRIVDNGKERGVFDSAGDSIPVTKARLTMEADRPNTCELELTHLRAVDVWAEVVGLDINGIRSDLERLARWDFDIMGDCVAEAQAVARAALAKLDMDKGQS